MGVYYAFPMVPLKIIVEKSRLNIAHSFAQATAQIESVAFDSGAEQLLQADVSVHGEGSRRFRCHCVEA
jgi:hypothetical protein